MRDPKRIKKVLKVLEGVWKQYPDLRLGQLLENALPANQNCIFYLEDGDLILALLEFVGHEKELVKTTRKKNRSKKFIGSGYKFPECLMPGGGDTGYGSSKVVKGKNRKGKK